MVRKIKINENIERIVLPYKDIFTSVWVIRTPDGVVLFDTASSAADAEDHILPWLEELGIAEEQIRYLFLSHNHRDHAGGLLQITATFPEAMIVSRCPDIKDAYWDSVLCPSDGDLLLKVLRVVTIPGHTPDSMALLDTRTGTLLTGDCLQLFGIYGSGEWGANITLPAEHLKALKRLEKLPIKSIYFAHDYHPVGQCAEGAAAVKKTLEACRTPLMRLKQIILENPDFDDAAVRKAYYGEERLPKVSLKVIAAVRAATKSRKI